MEHISILICGHRTFVACYEVIERCSYVLRERGKYVCFLAWPQDMSVTSYVTTEHVLTCFMTTEHVYRLLHDHRTRLWLVNDQRTCL